MIQFFLIFFTWIIAQEGDHLLLTRIVTQPDEAESFSIYNPTDSSVDLSHYYICDDEEYYNISIYPDSIFSSKSSGFTAQFPPIYIPAGDTLHIAVNENYSEFYGFDFIPDLKMFGSDNNSMIETELGSIGSQPNKIKETTELIILFR